MRSSLNAEQAEVVGNYIPISVIRKSWEEGISPSASKPEKLPQFASCGGPQGDSLYRGVTVRKVKGGGVVRVSYHT